MLVSFKVLITEDFYPRLEELYFLSMKCTERMLANRELNTTRYYPEIPSILANGLLRKYQRNKKCNKVNKLVLPMNSDSGKMVKTEGTNLRIKSLFGYKLIPITFPKPMIGHVHHVEFFKRQKKWFMSYCYETPCDETLKEVAGVLGIDRNSVGNVAVIANCDTGKVRKFGPSVAKIKENFRNRRRRLQKKGAKNALIKLRRKQSRVTKYINHSVSRSVVNYAKEHCLAIVMEDLSNIRKGKAKRYVEKSQWSFYQLQEFINYKAALLGIPIAYVSPKNTSRLCSRCGNINHPNGKRYVCSRCGHTDHRDANAAFNISKRGGQTIGHRASIVGSIGGPS